MENTIQFVLNGERRSVAGVSATTTLLQHLRSSGYTGSKEGCAEGDCGACTVALVETNAHGERTYRAINSCITLMPMIAGREIVTVEGIGQSAPHPVQKAMVERYGSQCGYCTPGFVVSMFEAYYRSDLDSRAKIGDQLSGNLCRCTGYRPIRDALVDALAQKDASDPDLFQLRLKKAEPSRPAVDYQHAGQRFMAPTTLADLLRLRAEHPEAVLVAGATEVGVELNKKHKAFPFLISTEAVRELTAITKSDDAYRIGGAATLTALEEALQGEYPAIDKMLWVFASRQIRNRATLAGNLVTASPIGDMAPLLLAFDASLELSSTRGVRQIPLSEFFLAYRKTALAPDEVVTAIMLPRHRGGGRRRVESYKVSKRRELDISIVAAAFLIDLGADGCVERARLAYGGVAATPIRAVRTEQWLVGKPWTRETLRGAGERLAAEFHPLSDVRSGDAFRRGLVVSLFEKFFAGDRSEAQDVSLDFETTPRSSRHALSPSQSLAHESGLGHVTGEAQYVDDEAQRRSMLVMWPVTVPHAHARIIRRDARKALTMPGIATVLLAEDIPGDNDIGAIAKGEPLLAEQLVEYHGQLVAVVVGETLEQCRRAAERVEIEVEPLPPILGIPDAIAAESFHTKPHVIRRGDVEAEVAGSPHQIQGEIAIGGQEHFYLETQAAWAEAGDDGDVRVVSSTQNPSEIQAVVSHVLRLARNRVVVQCPRMGGGFGGKETQGNAWAALVALAAMKTGRPVRVQLDRDLDMMITGKRHPFLARYRAGFDGEGRLRGVEVDLWSDGGWALDLSESICDRALFHLDNSYYIPSARFSGRVAKTNAVSHTAFRGFGGPQGMVVIEEVLDRIARSLQIRPEVVRERNLYHGKGESNKTPYGQDVGEERITAIWSKLRDSSELAARRAAITQFNASSERIKRGIAMTPVKFGISFTASFLNQAGALVVIYRDGSIQVNHGGTEMGQGLHTKIRGIAMRELGLPADKVRVMRTTTDKVPNTSATAASSGSDLNGAAVQNACMILRDRLAEVAADELAQPLGSRPEVTSIRFEDGYVFAVHALDQAIAFGTLVERAYLRQVGLSATGYYRTPGLAYDKSKGHGRPFHYFAYGAAVSEVEVDGYSGMKRVRRVDILHDVGDSLNPGIDRGQIEGGFVQGMGWLTGEELLWDASGRLLSHSASTYQIPAVGDAPAVFHVNLLPNAAQEGVIHGSKAVGEPPLMLAISVREAIRDAVAAFGDQTGEVFLPAPSTHEAIFHAVRAREAAEKAARHAAE